MTDLNDIRIRDFRPAELLPLRRMIHDTIDACYSGVYPPRAVQFFREFHSEARIAERHQTGEVLVGEKDGGIVATGSRVGDEILGVFVDPAHQGRGYGKAMMHELERRARAKGLAEVTLSVSMPSRGFYESLGYEVVQACSHDVGEGQRLDYWKARKAL